MKTFIIAIIFFIAWFLFWWGFWINLWLNFGFDALTSWFKDGINSSLSKDTLSWSYANLEQAINQKKEEFIQELWTKKEEVIQDIQNNIKQKIKDYVDNLF